MLFINIELVGETGMVNISGVGEMGVGKMGQTQGRIQDFWKGGIRFIKRGFFFNILHVPDIFYKFPHETEIIWFQRGVHSNHLNPL